MEGKKQQLSVTIDEDLIKDLDKLAEREGRSRSAIINILLQQSVPAALGKIPLHEGVEAPTSPPLTEQWRIIQDLFSEIEILKEKVRKVEKKKESEK